MIRVQKDNVQLRIEEKDLKEYERRGFKKLEPKLDDILKNDKKDNSGDKEPKDKEPENKNRRCLWI